jgi:hypothetical protein
MIEKQGASSMSSRVAKQILVWGGVLILIGALSLVNRFVAFGPWVWAAFLAGAGLGVFGLYLANRSDRLMLLAAYVLGAIAGLVALVPSEYLRDEAVAAYVLLAIALPFLALYLRDRRRWWALLVAYPLLVVVGVIGLAASGLVSDDLISACVMLAMAIPFFAIYARDRKRWWALILGGVLGVLALSFGTWLPWHSVRSSLIAGDAVKYAAALALLIGGVWVLVRATVGRNPPGEAARSGSGEPAAYSPKE